MKDTEIRLRRAINTSVSCPGWQAPIWGSGKAFCDHLIHLLDWRLGMEPGYKHGVVSTSCVSHGVVAVAARECSGDRTIPLWQCSLPLITTYWRAIWRPRTDPSALVTLQEWGNIVAGVHNHDFPNSRAYRHQRMLLDQDLILRRTLNTVRMALDETYEGGN